jgi:hypothetical protein
MSVVTCLSLVVALGVCLVPAWLLRRRQYRWAQDYLVASQLTRPQVVGNAAIASALRMAAFAPLFVWGARGDLWPALIASVFLGFGVWLVYVLRQPLLEFLDGALRDHSSITVHEFIARLHGSDGRVRTLSSSLSLCTLLGLLVGEALSLSQVIRPILNGSPAIASLLVLAALVLIVLITAVSGHSGILGSSQLLLGMVYLGLFASTVLLLYLHLSARTPMPAHGTLAVTLVAVFATVALWYRRSKYVDTEPIRSATSSGSVRESSGARLLSRFEKILNICLSILLVLIIIVALMELNAAPWASIVGESMAALRPRTEVPAVGLLALALLPLFYPLVDLTSWLRLAATQSGKGPGTDPDQPRMLRGVFRTCALETSLMWLFICMFGAIAAIAVGTPGATGVQTIGERLVAAGDIAAIVSPLLLICVCAAALSTMGALFSACLCTIRYDMLSLHWPEATPGQTEPAREATARRRTLVIGGILALAVAVAFCVADAFLHIGLTSNTFVALLFALCCAQLSFVPLVLGPIVGRSRKETGSVSPGWAMGILGCGAASGAVGVAMYLVTGVEAWLWSAPPACLGSGLVLFGIARAASNRGG